MSTFHVITPDRYVHGTFGSVNGAKKWVRRWCCDDRRVEDSKVFIKNGPEEWEFKRPYDVTKPGPKPVVRIVSTAVLCREYRQLMGRPEC